MKKFLSYILAGILGIGIGYGAHNVSDNIIHKEDNRAVEELTNSNILSVLWQQQSGEVKALRYQAYNSAINYIDELVKISSDKPYAVTLDLDETVLDNSLHAGFKIKNHELFTNENFKEWSMKAEAPQIDGAKKFTDYAKSKGIEVFYVSNRGEDELSATIDNMKKLNIINADREHILLKKDTNNKSSRWNTIREKYNLAMYCGDNLGDFFDNCDGTSNEQRRNLVDENSESFGTKYIVLPNPMYGDFESAVYNYNYGKSPKEKLFDRLKYINSFK